MLTKKREYLNTDTWHQLFLITDYGQEGRGENGGAEDNTCKSIWGTMVES
jgi:hypothetical protein